LDLESVLESTVWLFLINGTICKETTALNLEMWEYAHMALVIGSIENTLVVESYVYK